MSGQESDPFSLRTRGREHHGIPHPGLFYECLRCWPGAVLCGSCGHVTVDGLHGHMRLSASGLELLEEHECRASHDDSPLCGCPNPVVGERVVETDILPGSSGRPTPRAFNQDGLHGHRRGLGR